MNKKNHLIDTMVEKLTKLEKNWNTDHILSLLEEQRGLRDVTILKRDKLFDDIVLKFLFSNEKESKTFLHYTKDEFTARKISEEGFIFVNNFEKTAQQVFNDTIDLKYKHSIRKYYGKYIVVISISNDIYNFCDNELKLFNKTTIENEHFAMDIPSFFNDNQDEVFTLSKHFIKGYINYETGDIIHNPEFNMRYNTLIRQDQFN